MTYRTAFLSPLSPSALRADIDRLFDDVFSGPSTTTGESRDARARRPAASLTEDDDGWTLVADLPGVAPADVEVTAEGRTLSIRGARAARTTSESARLLLDERGADVFVRELRLPPTADPTAIDASMANGVLTVRIGKLAPAKPRRITVATTEAVRGPSEPATIADASN